MKEDIEGYLDGGNKVGMLLAWNGRSSDCSKLFEVSTPYEIMFQEHFVNGHNSLVDARAQAKVFANMHIQSHFDRTRCVILMDDVCTYRLFMLCLFMKRKRS
jgi:hypothetical protein